MARWIAAFIRHGDYRQRENTPSAHQPFPLNERGWEQARLAAEQLREQLAEQRWQLVPEIDCSDLLRAWQTAQQFSEVLAGSAGVPLNVEAYPALAERGLGSAANLSIAEIEAVVADDPRCEPLPADWKSNSHFRLPLPGAESLMAAGERVARHVQARMNELTARGGDGDTVKLFVGHGAAFRHAACHLGVLEYAQIARLSMYHARPVFLEYHPDGRWSHLGGEWKQRRHNSDYRD